MKSSTAALAAAATLGLASGAAAQESAAPTDPQARMSYALGLNLGQSLQRDGLIVDPAALARGVHDAMSGGKPALTDDEIRVALAQLQVQAQAHRVEAATQAAAANRAEGAAFLKTNAARPGVVTLPGGLQYEVLTKGSGPVPKLTDTVVCNYRGTLINGGEFDSSYKRGEPSSFPVSGVIKGWTQALQLMPVGSKWRLFVPAELAYGDKGAGADIGPGATLIFEVELLSIQ